MTTTVPVPTSSPPANARRPVPKSFVALMYHNVCPDHTSYPDLSPSATSYFVTECDFAEHLNDIAALGGSCMTWEAVNAFYGPSASTGAADPARQPSVLLSFYDGWSGAVELGGQILKRHESQAIVFVTTDFLGHRHFLSRAELAKFGPARFRVGSHARTQRMLSLLSEPDIRRELDDSKKALEDLTGYGVDALSIPSGAVDQRVRRIAAECGYRLVFDSEVRVNCRGDSPAA